MKVISLDCAESSDGYLLVGVSADGSQTMTDGDYPTDAFLVKVNKTTGANIFINRFGNGNSTSQGDQRGYYSLFRAFS
ncbi:MAG: hypothetical protein KatS3mg027_1263 [Bacteroidia bacterium]|nr:MAG: hypothetical protein KatS3mg027_1263 [Bacteroidia bacterium]